MKPVLKLINQHFIPVLQHEKGTLCIKTVPIYEKESVLKPSVSGYQYQIAIREPSIFEENTTLIHKMYQIPRSSYIDQHLFSDMEDHHYPKIVDSFKKIQEDFDKYNDSCRLCAEELKKQMLSGVCLPERVPSDHSQEKWINANEFAIFILERHLGVNKPHHVRSGPGEKGYFVLTIEMTTLAQGTEVEMQSTAAIIDNLAREANQSQELLAMASTQLEKVIKLRDELERLIRSYKLSGSCNYCKI